MNTEILNLGGYEFFVYSAFLFTFLICSYLFFKTKKELKALEKLFYKDLIKISEIEAREIEEKKLNKELISTSPKFIH